MSSTISPTTDGLQLPSSLSEMRRGEVVGGPIRQPLNLTNTPRKLPVVEANRTEDANLTHQSHLSLAISQSWLWTVVVVGSRPAMRSGRVTGAWNRCDAYFGQEIEDRKMIVEMLKFLFL